MNDLDLTTCAVCGEPVRQERFSGGGLYVHAASGSYVRGDHHVRLAPRPSLFEPSDLRACTDPKHRVASEPDDDKEMRDDEPAE